MSQDTTTGESRRERRSTLAAFVGTATEWYDFFLFGTASALVFSKVFYPEFAAGSGLMASFATMWVGFIARPLGGAFFGHFGDRLGRKNVLVATLMLMGAATTAIGLLPTYAQIGAGAPILLILLRALQGFAVGGEWGGAVVMATENADPARKTSAGAWVQQGSPAGSILSTLAFMLVGMLPDDQFLAWGWRIPFLLSAVLVGVGLFIRFRVTESREFAEVKNAEATVRLPIADVFTKTPKILLLGMAVAVTGATTVYFNNTFLLSWTTSELDMNRSVILNVLLGMSILQFLWTPLTARLAGAWGEYRVLVGGLITMIVLAVPFFAAIGSADVAAIAVTLYLSTLGYGAYWAILANWMSSAFPPEVRYSGVSVAYQLCSSIVGGGTPLLSQWILTGSGGNQWAVAAYYIVLQLITIGGVWALHSGMARGRARQSPSAGLVNA
ncbi:MFS transporter [Nocardia sp. BMG51109]|uniref:MFS transporter n=1 Tax=Nocardia sp. BMG51109 TaxID=1056816 RepID=UPI0004655F9C|nr:MFS transporter [Nocardia sp. BMG51109]